ncbi:MAG TPA: hypothetical protein VKQ09_01995 [Sphingomonas sp.]|jgi:hypothetical protein|nr:hypothetical protein [Sphingomonas sp.]
MRCVLLIALAATLPIATPGAAQEQKEQKQQNKVERAATEPLRDTRIREDKIPPILQLAGSAPYSTKDMTSCDRIAAEVGKLNAALGVDVDVPGKAKGEGSEVAAAAAGEVVRSIIPGLGLLRVVTGADKQQRRVQAAVYAGSVRRGFLKGLGLSRHCEAPAAPTREAQSAVPELSPMP